MDMFNKIMGEVQLSIGTLTTLISTAATSDLELLIPGEVLPSFWLLKLVFLMRKLRSSTKYASCWHETQRSNLKHLIDA